jgi:hypothetical protein
MENTMTSHRPLRSTVDGLAAVAIGAALMAAGPIGAASAAGGRGGVGHGVGVGAGPSGESGQAANGSGHEPSETDCSTIVQQPGRYAPEDASACGVTPPMEGYGYYPTESYGSYPPRG